MLWLPAGLRPLTRGTASFFLALLCPRVPPSAEAPGGMYAARFYGGGGGGGGGKPGRRPGMVGAGLPVLENHPHHHHHPLPPHPHPHAPPPQNYPAVYQGRPDGHRLHFQSHHHHHHHQPHFHPHPQPHPAPPHYHAHAGLHPGRKKTWNFIHEKMSYDTFFTMKRLIERSRGVDEVLRWVTQNPGKISYNHYPIALQKIGQLLQAQQASGAGPSSGGGGGGGGGGGKSYALRQMHGHHSVQLDIGRTPDPEEERASTYVKSRRRHSQMGAPAYRSRQSLSSPGPNATEMDLLVMRERSRRGVRNSGYDAFRFAQLPEMTMGSPPPPIPPRTGPPLVTSLRRSSSDIGPKSRTSECSVPEMSSTLDSDPYGPLSRVPLPAITADQSLSHYSGNPITAVYAIPASRAGYTGYFAPTPPSSYRSPSWMSYPPEPEDLTQQWTDLNQCHLETIC